MSSPSLDKLRNVCIIAHVDHGKTTLVDHLLRQSGTFQAHQSLSDRVMDSMDLERERGITILAKNAAITVGDTKINVVDTPGHADFGGEVERVIGLADGALLLVDAAEGPLPQTRFVLKKALAAGQRVILVINKVDRPDARIDEVVDMAFDLFVDLGASDKQADFPIVYACARQGWCTLDRDAVDEHVSLGEASREKLGASLQPLFDLILKEVPAPQANREAPFQCLVSNLSYSDFVGRLALVRVLGGNVKRNQKIKRMGEGGRVQTFSVVRLYSFRGLKMEETQEIAAGDIGLIAGSEEVEIGDTLGEMDGVSPLPRIEVEKPTLAMVFSVNTGPLSGKEGEPIQSRKLRERLEREVRNNVALRLEESQTSDQLRLLGRGELQFAILIEQMRREGFEFMVGKPTILMKHDENGQKLEPMERAVLDLPASSSGEVTELFQRRKGILTKYEESGSGTGRVRLEFEIPTRGLLGMRSRYLTATRGEGLMSVEQLGYAPYKGELPHRINGSLVSDRSGTAIEYALLNLEDRGQLFIKPGAPVYEGMIIGEHSKENDLNVNPCKEKKLTNIRAAHAELLVTLAGVRDMSLERSIEWIDEDEWIEVTPESVRLRKKMLAQNQRPVTRSRG